MIATLAFALVAWVAWGAARRTRRPAWWVILGVSAFLLLDNLTRLHELIPVWPAVYAPLLCALAAAAIAVARGSALAAPLQVGLALLLASLLIHALNTVGADLGWWPADESRFELWRYQLLIAIKEGTELAGWLLFVPALVLLASGGVTDRGTPQAPAGLLGGRRRQDQLRARGEQLLRRWVLLALARERDPAGGDESAVGRETP